VSAGNGDDGGSTEVSSVSGDRVLWSTGNTADVSVGVGGKVEVGAKDGTNPGGSGDGAALAS